MATSKIKCDSIGYTSVNTHIQYAKRNGIMMVRFNSGNSVELTRNGTVLGSIPAELSPPAQSDFHGTALGGSENIFFRINSQGQVTGYANTSTVYWSGIATYIPK